MDDRDPVGVRGGEQAQGTAAVIQVLEVAAVDAEAIDRSPVERFRQPKTPTKLVPGMVEKDTGRVQGQRARATGTQGSGGWRNWWYLKSTGPCCAAGPVVPSPLLRVEGHTRAWKSLRAFYV